YYRIMWQQGRLMKANCLAQSSKFSAFREGLYQCRTYLSLLLRACCPGRAADIMAAMLLGEKGALDEEIKSLYQQNGIIHILAISGLHLSLLGMGVYRIGRRLRIPNAVNIILSIALLYCYGTMVGMGVSIIRALIMFGLKLSASLFKRTYDMLTAMMTSALLILVQQPLYLTHSGFLFSFGAICAIGLFPAVSACFPFQYGPVKALAAGLWVAVFTLPVHLCFYYQFPPYSVFLNLLVIPCMGAVLLSGIAAVATGALSLSLGHIASLPGAAILIFYERCCDFCAKLPGRQWIAGCPAKGQLVVFFGLVALAVFFAVKKRKREFAAGIVLAVTVLCLRFSMGLEITVLDVGQGDCIYLSEGGKSHYLIDGGSSDKSGVDTYQIVPFLKYRGVSGLDTVFVTHPDSDHENGIRSMLENYEESDIRIDMLVLPDVAEESKNENYLTLQSLAEDRGIPVRFVHEGQRIDRGDLAFLCIHPAEGYVCGEANAYSTVLALTYGRFTALFTGDLEGEGESLVMERLAQMKTDTERSLPESFTLLKVAHHGSRNSTSEEFLELSDPRIALISAGRDNSYGHPHGETMERLAEQGCRVYQTPVSGAVTIRVKRDRVYVEEYIK
ncbi:MAG: DNA internalization-related competence protein ComEC/Rec2, partial [Lachnospiraceae bacterium]|nr:DNA internalization-related competence protein ComEC/Rec2 [Lachnospiraceae bacterium]